MYFHGNFVCSRVRILLDMPFLIDRQPAAGKNTEGNSLFFGRSANDSLNCLLLDKLSCFLGCVPITFSTVKRFAYFKTKFVLANNGFVP